MNITYTKGYEAGYKDGSADTAQKINEMFVHELSVFIAFHTAMLVVDPEHERENQMAINVLETLRDTMKEFPYE